MNEIKKIKGTVKRQFLPLFTVGLPADCGAVPFNYGGIMKKANLWKERVTFDSGGEGAWAGLVELLEKKKIGLNGESPVYIHFPDWEGDIRDYIIVSNSPIEKKSKRSMPDSLNLKKYKLGDLVVGMRYGSSGHLKVGTLVDAYVTINYPYRNPAYVLLCEDGKKRVYQGIQKLEEFSDSTWMQSEKNAYAKQIENIKNAQVKK